MMWTRDSIMKELRVDDIKNQLSYLKEKLEKGEKYAKNSILEKIEELEEELRDLQVEKGFGEINLKQECIVL